MTHYPAQSCIPSASRGKMCLSWTGYFHLLSWASLNHSWSQISRLTIVSTDCQNWNPGLGWSNEKRRPSSKGQNFPSENTHLWLGASAWCHLNYELQRGWRFLRCSLICVTVILGMGEAPVVSRHFSVYRHWHRKHQKFRSPMHAVSAWLCALGMGNRVQSATAGGRFCRLCIQKLVSVLRNLVAVGTLILSLLWKHPSPDSGTRRVATRTQMITETLEGT